MFDFSPAGILLRFVSGLWVPFTMVAFFAIGAVLVTLVVVCWRRSHMLRAGLLSLAVVLGLSGLVWQAAEYRGRRSTYARQHAIAIAAERERLTKSKADSRVIAKQGAKDLAEAQADFAHLKDLLDALSGDPRGSHLAVPRDWARRLRAL